MKRALSFVLVAAAPVWLSGCASTPPSSGGKSPRPALVERASDSKPYDFRSEGTIPPLSATDAANEPDVEEMGVTETPIEASDAEAPPETIREAAPTDTLVDGFRVQVFASADREIAENAARGAQERLGLPGYVELDGGVYKVRVGDFAARADADQALVGIRRQYADAWIVPSKVRAPQRP